MTTADSIRAEFLRDICEHPEDDTPRLIFADWLEDHGEPERAEFIRVQCELAAWNRECCCHIFESKPGNTTPQCANCFDRETMSRRERGLLRGVSSSFKLNVCEWVPGWWVTGSMFFEDGSVDFVKPFSDRVKLCAYFRRGFVASISLTLDDFMKYALSLFREHPITEVTLTDRKPYVSGFSGLGVATWYDACGERGGIDPSSSDLPTNLFLALSGEDRFNEGNGIKYYDSLDPALAAISLACVTYGRKLVGLPPLKGTNKTKG